MVPDFPKAKQAISERVSEFFQQRIHYHSGGFLAQIPTRLVPEGDKTRMIYEDGFVRESKMKKIDAQGEIDNDVLVNNPEKMIDLLDQMAKQAAAQQSEMIFKSIMEVTTDIGNVVTTGKKFGGEDVLRMIEKVEINFAADGRPIMPQAVGGEQAALAFAEAIKEIDSSPELAQRLNEIISLKKQQWIDRENNRKLVG